MDEIRSFRTLGLEPGILNLGSIVLNTHSLAFQGLKLLGFKKKSLIAFEDNVKHTLFVYPDELVDGSALFAPFVVLSLCL